VLRRGRGRYEVNGGRGFEDSGKDNERKEPGLLKH